MTQANQCPNLLIIDPNGHKILELVNLNEFANELCRIMINSVAN